MDPNNDKENDGVNDAKKKLKSRKRPRADSGDVDGILMEVQKYCDFEDVKVEDPVKSRPNLKTKYTAIATLVNPYTPGAIVPSEVNTPMQFFSVNLFVNESYFKMWIIVNECNELKQLKKC